MKVFGEEAPASGIRASINHGRNVDILSESFGATMPDTALDAIKLFNDYGPLWITVSQGTSDAGATEHATPGSTCCAQRRRQHELPCLRPDAVVRLSSRIRTSG
jgi:hypothetical protein